MGSLVAAVASYLSVKQQHGRWLIRVDDLDTPRNQPGAAEDIIQTLKAHGLTPDGPIIFQSDRKDRYASALRTLQDQHLCFYCRCPRKSLPRGKPYPGTCRAVTSPLDDAAIRLRVDGSTATFDDLVHGHQAMNLRDMGDFIVQRRDSIPAYHLACAVDDGSAEISEVVRGADLLSETPPQLYIMTLLGLQAPAYGHIPTLTDRHGVKLSKQAHAPAVQAADHLANLTHALAALGIRNPPSSAHGEPSQILRWAAERFDIRAVPRTLEAGFRPGL